MFTMCMVVQSRGTFSWGTTIHTAIYGEYVQFWPTLGKMLTADTELPSSGGHC